jgi:DinB superfamily
MKLLQSCCVSLLLIVACGSALSQTATPDNRRSPSQIMDRTVDNLENEFTPAAEAMPEDKYSFAPVNGEFKGVRTFAQQVKHVAAVNYMLAAAILEEKPPVELGGENGPDSVKSKADILKFLKDSFAYQHKAVSSLTDTNLVGMVKSPFGDGMASRLGLATLSIAHPFDHYGQMVEYLRMNGIVPPASRAQ